MPRTRTPTVRTLFASKSIWPAAVTRCHRRAVAVGTSFTMGTLAPSVMAPNRVADPNECHTQAAQETRTTNSNDAKRCNTMLNPLKSPSPYSTQSAHAGAHGNRQGGAAGASRHENAPGAHSIQSPTPTLHTRPRKPAWEQVGGGQQARQIPPRSRNSITHPQPYTSAHAGRHGNRRGGGGQQARQSPPAPTHQRPCPAGSGRAR